MGSVLWRHIWTRLETKTIQIPRLRFQHSLDFDWSSQTEPIRKSSQKMSTINQKLSRVATEASSSLQHWLSQMKLKLSNTHERQCFIRFPNTGELKIQCVAEYFCRNMRCLEIAWDKLLSVWYTYSIETKTGEEMEK